MNAFMNALIKMSLRGIVIILVVLLVRILLKKLQIGHKYILGLWAMAFLYFVFPWKLRLSVGFWNNARITEEMRVLSELRSAENESYGEIGGTGNIVDPAGVADSIMTGVPAATPKDTARTVTVIPVESVGQNIAGVDGIKGNSPAIFEAGRVIEFIWLVGLSCFFGHMLYSYFALKRKLRLSVIFENNIWWAENIGMPMVFGLIHPRIYLPVSMETQDLSYVIAHEKVHVKRKDGLFKMFAYVVCLIHWFNPFIWMAYFLFGSDMEKACDEEVIRTMSREKRKEYAYALLHIAAGNGSGKKRIFVAPICFDEGNVKSRIRNIMKYKYTLPGIGIAVVIVIMALSVIFLTEERDNSLLAVGLDMGNKEKVTQVNGELVETQTNRYGDDFVPVQVIEYSVNNNLIILSKLEFGMSIEEVEEILNSADMHTFRVDESVYNEGYIVGLSAEYSQYHCYFDSQNKLVRIAIQEGGSRDGRFTLGMSLSDLEKVVEEAGGSFAKEASDTPYEIWFYQDQEQQMRYEFFVYEGSVSVVNEMVINEKETMTIVHESADILYYEDGSPYIHDILTNNTDKRIVETEYCMLAYNEKGLPLKLHWNFPDSSTEVSYENLVRTKTSILPDQTEDYHGGWSLYDGEITENLPKTENGEVDQVVYSLFCLKQVVFEDGTVWNNPNYSDWYEAYAGKTIDIDELQNYYPYQYELGLDAFIKDDEMFTMEV